MSKFLEVLENIRILGALCNVEVFGNYKFPRGKLPCSCMVGQWRISGVVGEYEIPRVLGNFIISIDSWLLSTKYWCQISELTAQHYLKVI